MGPSAIASTIALNEITLKDKYLIPRIDELLENMAGAHLQQGYHQIRVKPERVLRTAFQTTFGSFRFCVMPFGLKNAPETFRRTMNNLLSQFREFADVYIDNIVIFLRTLKEHVARVRQTFVRNFANIAANLTALLKTTARCILGETQQKAFDELKAGLRMSSNLANPNFTKDFVLYMDASADVIGATISQEDSAGNLRLLTCTSRKLIPAECTYSTLERKILALVHAINFQKAAAVRGLQSFK